MAIFNRGWFFALVGVVLFACLFASVTEALKGASVTEAPHDRSLAQARAAFAKVSVGRTLVPDLAGLGFDASHPGVQTLSYLGVVEHFMPATARAFDAADPAIQQCLTAQGRCTAYIFPLVHAQVSYSFFGTEAHAAAPITGPRATFLIRGGRVVWKDFAER